MFRKVLEGVSIGGIVKVTGALLLTSIFLLSKRKGKFDGYVCEKCGKEYNSCEHKFDEDYTLVKL